MWIPILVMALAVSLEPFRVAMTVLMVNRPRPALQLLAFLSGGFAMGMTVGLVVIFVLRRRLVASTHLTLPRVQILIGGLALLVAALLAARVALGRWRRQPLERGADRGIVSDMLERLRTPLRRLLNGRSLWVAGVAGLGIGLPSVDYLAVLAVILASGAAATTQIGALVLFNVTAFALVEISLVAYLVAPNRTRESLTALNNWIASRRRLEVAALLVVVGGVLLALGLAGI